MGEGQSLTVLQETKPSLYHVISSVVWDSKDSTSYLNNYLVSCRMRSSRHCKKKKTENESLCSKKRT